MNRKKEMTAGFLFIAPSILLIVLLIGYPMIYNFIISFHKVPVNPKKPMQFVNFGNFTKTLADPSFYKALGVTVFFTLLVVFLSTAVGLAVAILLNRRFFGKKIVKALILLPYIVPSVSLIFAWKYMFNNTYGIVNYLFVDVLGLFERAPLWFDRPASAFVLVTLFCVWKFFPYAFMSFYAILRPSTGRCTKRRMWTARTAGRNSKSLHCRKSSRCWRQLLHSAPYGYFICTRKLHF